MTQDAKRLSLSAADIDEHERYIRRMRSLRKWCFVGLACSLLPGLLLLVVWESPTSGWFMGAAFACLVSGVGNSITIKLSTSAFERMRREAEPVAPDGRLPADASEA